MRNALFYSLLILGLCAPLWAQDEPPDPTNVKLSPAVRMLIDDPLTDAGQRRRLRLFHGRWEEIDTPLRPAEKAQVALWRWALDDPALRDAAAPVELRAEAALRRGDPKAALALLPDLPAPAIALLRARAMVDLGQTSEAVAALRPVRDMLISAQLDDAQQMTAAAQAVVLLAQLEGRPAQDYHSAMEMLGKAHNELDRFYWPAHLAEAQLLLSKDNPPAALQALDQALRLNPRASEGWYRLGLLAVESFQFEAADKCVAKLTEINPQHPLAALLKARTMIAQKDSMHAREALAPALERYPDNRDVAAMAVAVAAIGYDEKAEAQAVQRFNALAPGNPTAYALAGKYLALARQYEHGEKLLRQAIALQPNAAEPRIELGLLLMQSGNEKAALETLREAVRVDPFNIRAANQHELVEAMINEYRSVTTEHFIIRYKPGIDEALANDMLQELERVYDEVTRIFEHQPAHKTIIEVLPNERHFAVRITGIPEIWTIAASTGDVIAMTPPRIGSKQRGTFNWLTVVRHEFVHTVTLDQTRNRVPHWFTEACAVSTEPAGRDYGSAQLLAAALRENKLFDLHEINWAFVRPKRPFDRQLAYMQAYWMLEYTTQTYGHGAIVAMLTLFRGGISTEDAIRQVCKVEPEAFTSSFKQWAGGEVERWGLGPYPTDWPKAQDIGAAADGHVGELRAIPDENTKAPQQAELLKKYPKHPELLRLVAAKEKDPEIARELTLRYASVRPVDPWWQRRLAELSLKTNRPREAIAALEEIDRIENSSGEWAVQLAQVYRKLEEYPLALDAMRRALHREPYNASYRELAAAVALQAGDQETALRHLIALTLIEPQRSVHFVRLAAMHAKLGNGEKANAAAQEALKLDPQAPVEKFLKGHGH